MFQGLYPLPEEEVKVISNQLLYHFQGPTGHYNGLASPFTEIFRRRLYDGKELPFFAALYPVIDSEFVNDYERRKTSEKCVSLIQRQTIQACPAITQWRYSRSFDFAEEGQHQSDLFGGQDMCQSVQSARGLFEYSCGELDTLDLDRRQISLLDQGPSGAQGKCLLQVDPLWLLVFPDSSMLDLIYLILQGKL
jgi:hypothetical protein